jgi:redox-sensitive bicupin YhaK (pirin superfamily)
MSLARLDQGINFVKSITMKRSIKSSSGGRNVRVADWQVNRLIPGGEIVKVGPFVLLDHLYPVIQKGCEPAPYKGQYAHPHRGIITLSYVLCGSLHHLDSRDGDKVVGEGGVQWMKAGNGIIHDERPDADLQRKGGLLHVLQFWINLPAVNKADEPEYKALTADVIPELELPEYSGTLRILLGGSGVLKAPVDTYLDEFIYHIRLNPKSSFSCATRDYLEYAVFVPADEVHVNGEVIGKSHLVLPVDDGSAIRLYNPGITVVDLFIFGGKEYLEPIVQEGPFVMTSRAEIARAYRDFFEGRYGELKRD